MPPRLRGARYTRGTKRARGAASIARSKSATPTRWQSVVFVIPAHTTSARPTRSTGSPKNVALARNKTRSVACIKTAELRRLFLRAAPFVCAIFTCGRIDSALMLVELGAPSTCQVAACEGWRQTHHTRLRYLHTRIRCGGRR
jgi:hypothetical protein